MDGQRQLMWEHTALRRLGTQPQALIGPALAGANGLDNLFDKGGRIARTTSTPHALALGNDSPRPA